MCTHILENQGPKWDYYSLFSKSLADMVWKSTMGQLCSGSPGLVDQEGFPTLYQVLPISLQQSAGFRGARPSPRMCITLPAKCGLHPEAKLDRFRASRQMLPAPRLFEAEIVIQRLWIFRLLVLRPVLPEARSLAFPSWWKTKQARTLSGELYNNTLLPEAASRWLWVKGSSP